MQSLLLRSWTQKPGPAITDGMKVGCALGGGGVRGLAHISALETMASCGVRPDAMAGTSMGAIIAAFYASGWSGAQIRTFFERHIIERGDSWKTLYPKRHGLLKWLSAFGISLQGNGLLKVDGLLRYLIESIEADTFEDLVIPLKVVATDFHSGMPVVFDRGPLAPAIQASISIPGVFVPVRHAGRVLVDGGVVNNLPYDLLPDDCDVTIAVDVIPTPAEECADSPNMVDAILGMLDVMVAQLTHIKLAAHPPTIYVRPQLREIRALDFMKAADVWEQAQPEMNEFRKTLESRGFSKPA